jgi:hypothetical protein
MLRKTFLILSSSAVLGAAVLASNSALAFGPLPLPPMGGLPHLGGPPPMAHLGGLPHFGGLPARAGGPAPRASFGGPAGRFNGLSGGRSAAYGHGRSAGYGYGRSGYSRYGRGEWRHRYERYGAYAGGSDGYSSDGGCSYTYTSSGRRVAVCDDN